MREPLVTILTPVHNGAPYLSECIESVLRQTYQNWHYVILDNASTDETCEIARQYTSDARVRLIHMPELVPVIANHNRAFKLLDQRSAYCKVVSADDWLYPDCLARLVAVALTYPNVGIVGCYQVSGGAGLAWRDWRISWEHIPIPAFSFDQPCPVSVMPGRVVAREHFTNREAGMEVFGSPTSLLYRADLIRETPEFYPNPSAEADTSAVCRSLIKSDYAFAHQVLCYERINNAGRMTTKSQEMNAYIPSLLSELFNYGRELLTPEDWTRCHDEIVDEYYRFLAISSLNRRDAKFWDYHKTRMQELGMPLNRVRLAFAITRLTGELATNPGLVWEKLRRRHGKAAGGVP